MVVIRFRNAEDAKDFAQEYNGRPFNPLQVRRPRQILPRL